MAHIISVIGAKGGVGKSVFAANLAFAITGEERKRVLLIDGNPKSLGDLSLITGIKPRKTVRELAEFNGNLDNRSINSFVATHKNGVSYIAMDRDEHAASETNLDSLSKHLRALKKLYSYVIVDVGSELSGLTLKFLENTTMITMVLGPDILGINQAKKLLSDIETNMFPREMVQLVLNQSIKGHPVGPELIRKQLGRSLLGAIPKDDNGCVSALNRSTPLVLANRNSPFSEGVLAFYRKVKQNNLLRKLEGLAKPMTSDLGTDQNSSHPGKGKQKNNRWTDLKRRIHRGIVEEMDLSQTTRDDDPKANIILREKTKKLVVELLNKEETAGIVKTRDDKNQIVKEILDEALGLGALEDLLSNPSISEIMVVGPDRIYYEQAGKNKLSDVTFTSDRQVLQVIERIVAPIGRRIDEKTPYVDARLHDGSRVHAIIPPCAIDGCTITIRKFPENRLTYKDLVQFGSMTQEMADFLRIAVESHKNVIVSGGTGSGKTTLINVLGSFIPSNERIITVEDSAELDLPQDHIVRLETRPPTLEGDGAIDIRMLVKQTLRMKPDRIVVGECRGGEALDMLQAMNTGHDGSMTTIHSNSPRDCMSRLETLVQYTGVGLTQRAIREMIASAVDIIVQQSRLEDGSRKVMSITEVAGMQGDVITLQDIFSFQQEGVDKKGKVVGKFQASGFIPKFVESLERKGVKIPRGIFSNKSTPSGENADRDSTRSSNPKNRKKGAA